MASNAPTDFAFGLSRAPRSLSALSSEHPDGWGIAVGGGAPFDWEVHRNAACAGADERFEEVAARVRGTVLVAHIRKRTVGPIGHDNTHPFHRGRWVFAHNGTIGDLDFLRAESSPARLAEVVGTTDSELFFAYLLTRLDALGHPPASTDGAAEAEIDAHARRVRVDQAIRSAMASALARPELGAVNFVLSDGETLYAHRHGRTLFLLERAAGDPVVSSRRSPETRATLETPWTERRQAIFVASEAMTPEPWHPIEEGTLLRIDLGPAPSWVRLR